MSKQTNDHEFIYIKKQTKIPKKTTPQKTPRTKQNNSLASKQTWIIIHLPVHSADWTIHISWTRAKWRLGGGWILFCRCDKSCKYGGFICSNNWARAFAVTFFGYSPAIKCELKKKCICYKIKCSLLLKMYMNNMHFAFRNLIYPFLKM